MSNITHYALVRTLVKDPASIRDSLTLSGINLWHAATGVAGEVGELLECVSAGFPNIDRTNLIEELGDIEFYMEQIRQQLAMTHNSESILSVVKEMELTIESIERNAVSAVIYGTGILDTIKKAVIYNKSLDIDTLCDQMLRLDIAMSTIRLAMGIQRTKVLGANIAKLKVRYEGLQYSDTAAQERADKPEEKEQPKRKTFGDPLSA